MANDKKGYLFHILLITIGTLLYFAANIQRVSVPGAIFDTLQQDLQTNPAIITALGASFMYVYATSQLVVGLLVSRYGGYRVITWGSILFSLGCFLFPIANSVAVLYLSRALVGLGSSTLYLGIIQEMKKVVPKNNFGIALSITLFVGYLGGIIANAPLVVIVSKIGWRTAFFNLALFGVILTLLFLFFKMFVQKPQTNKNVKFNFDLYKNVLKKENNISLYLFGGLNYGIYYLLQTVIGKKFLEDFCGINLMHAAVILSLMGALYASAGPVLAALSKFLLNRKTIFLKITAINTFCVLLFTLSCLIFDIKTPIIAVLFCSVAFFACLSPLLIPLLHDYNPDKEASISVCVMTASFYFIVAILGNVAGNILNMFEPVIRNGISVYSNKAYITIFLILIVLSVISLINAFKIKDSKRTIRFLKMCEFLENKYGDKWHERYENEVYPHDLISAVQ